jgi:hypothetical protein
MATRNQPSRRRARCSWPRTWLMSSSSSPPGFYVPSANRSGGARRAKSEARVRASSRPPARFSSEGESRPWPLSSGADRTVPSVDPSPGAVPLGASCSAPRRSIRTTGGASTCAATRPDFATTYLGKGRLVYIEGRLQARQALLGSRTPENRSSSRCTAYRGSCQREHAAAPMRLANWHVIWPI